MILHTKFPDSSNILWITYDTTTFDLTVQFRKGKYKYSQVPEAIYHAAIAAESIGKFIQANVVGKFDFVKVDEIL